MRVCLLTCFAFMSCADVVEHGAPVSLTLRTSCDPDAPPLAADGWRVRAKVKLPPNEGPPAGFEGGVWERTFPTFPQSIALPVTTDAVLTFEALEGGVVIGRGASTHIAVTGPTPDSVVIDVFPVGRITRQCGALATARSGHSATQLADGTVLIAGGRDSDGVVLSSMERISRTIEARKELSIVGSGTRFLLPRAFHSAVLTESGQVLFAGGENTAPMGATAVLSTLLLYDLDADDFGAIPTGLARWTGRTRHTAVLHAGRVYFAGGVSSVNGALLATTEIDRFVLATNTFDPPLQLTDARDEAAIINTGAELVLAGGTEQGQPSRTVRIGALDSTTVRTAQLLEARAAAFAVKLGEGVLIGAGVGSGSTFLTSSEWLQGAAGPPVTPRSKPCAVSLPTGAFVFGGVDGFAASGAAEWFDAQGNKTDVPFSGDRRFDHTCTALEDGSVLIVGGRNPSGALNDLWRFVPPQ